MPKKISVTVPDEYYEEIKKYCIAKGYISVASLIKMSIKRYMNLYEKK